MHVARRLAFLALIALTGLGTTCIEPLVFGFVPGVGAAVDVVVTDGLAFVASSEFGVSIADVSDPRDPTVVGSSAIPFRGAHVAARGSRVVVAGATLTGAPHVWVLDRAPLSRPRVLGELSAEQLGAARDALASQLALEDVALDSSGTLAVVAQGAQGIVVVDVSDPTAPRVVGSYDTPGIAYGVDVQGTVAYVADGLGGLAVFALATSGRPTLLATRSLTGVMRDVDLAGSIAYLANQQGGIKIVDVSNPSSPRQIAFATTTGFTFHLAAHGGRVAALSDDGKSTWLDLLDVSDPLRPTTSGSVPVGPVGAAHGIDLAGGLAYVATGREGLKIYAAGGAATEPDLQSIAADHFVASAIAEEGAIAVVVGEHVPTKSALLRVLDLTVPEAPVVIGELGTGESVGPVSGLLDVEIDASGRLAVVARGVAGISVIDLSDPTAPRIIGSYDTAGTAYAVDIQGSLVYVADGLGDLAIVTISNPARPFLVATKSLTGIMRDVEVSDSLAYLANQQGGFKVVDVSNPFEPRLIGAQGTAGFAFHVAVDGARVGVLSDDGTATFFDLMDISDPARPVRLASLPVGSVGSAYGIELAGSLAFLALGREGLALYDIGRTLEPIEYARMRSIGEARDVKQCGLGACVADSSAMITLVTLVGSSSNASLPR